VEHSNWKSRTAGGTWTPRFGIVHATAANRQSSDTQQVAIVRDGRQGLSGPIANACVRRDGTWDVISANRCNTTIAGTAGPYEGLGNTYALGVEACNDNGLHSPPEVWPAVQYRSYVRGWAVIARRLGWGVDRIRGHKEHTPGHKTDPTFNMSLFRMHVEQVMAGRDPWIEEEEDSVFTEAEKNQLMKWAEAASERINGLAKLLDGVPATWSTVNPNAIDPLPLSVAIKSITSKPPVVIDVPALAKQLSELLPQLPAEQITKAVKQALREGTGDTP
jgi:hypothetical protein